MHVQFADGESEDDGAPNELISGLSLDMILCRGRPPMISVKLCVDTTKRNVVDLSLEVGGGKFWVSWE